MPGVHPRYTKVVPTRPLNNGVSCLGGQVMVADVSVGGVSAVKPATGTDVTIEGVALTDATGTPNPQTQPLNAAYLPAVVAVARQCTVPVTYSNACNFGDPLKTAANGQVAKFVTGTDTGIPIGTCQALSGSVASGAVDYAFIR